MNKASPGERNSLIAGIFTYLIWGLLPLFFQLLQSVDPVEVVTQRVIWSLGLVLITLMLRSNFPAFVKALNTPRILAALSLSGVLIGANWMTYIWAVHAGHVVGASLGYFLNPLLNVLMGVLVLKERLRRAQTIAILVAAVGVAFMAFAALDTLWVSFALAITFSLYGLVRKVTPVDAFVGLGVETLILAPLAFGWCIYIYMLGQLSFGQNGATTTLMILCGVITTVPLVLFAIAAQRLPLSTLGLLQYISPTLQFFSGLFFFGEKLTMGQMISFGFIWAGLALFVADNLSANRARKVAAN